MVIKTGLTQIVCVSPWNYVLFVEIAPLEGIMELLVVKAVKVSLKDQFGNNWVISVEEQKTVKSQNITEIGVSIVVFKNA